MIAGDRHAGAIRRWLLAACAAASLHSGVAAWMIIDPHAVEPEVEADGSSLPVDITALTAVSPEDIAVNTGEPSPEVAPQQATQAEATVLPPPASEKSDVLLEQQSPESSDVVLPKPAEEQKEDDSEIVEQKKPAPPQQPLDAVAEQRPSAPAPDVAPPAPTPVSNSQGIKPSQRRSRNSWEKTLVTHLDKHKRFPEEARKAKATGEALVEFVMDRAGAVLSRRLVQGSGSEDLDTEAMELLSRAAPLPLPPQDIEGEMFHLIVPVRFRLR